MKLIRKKIGPFMMLMDPRDHGVGQRLAAQGYREPCFIHLIDRYACGIGIDCGANIGQNTLHMANRCDFVYAVEPDERTRSLLARNVRINGFLDRVRICPVAISDHHGECQFLPTKRPNLSSILIDKEDASKAIPVPCVPLSAIAFENPDELFVKMDIEGAEVVVLTGAFEYLCEPRLCRILMELHPERYNSSNDMAAVLRLYLKAGFAIKFFENAKGYKCSFALNPVEWAPEFAFPRAVFSAKYHSQEDLVRWATTLTDRGDKMIRAILLERSV